jgi:DNA polymerase elongation subunit (family B)
MLDKARLCGTIGVSSSTVVCTFTHGHHIQNVQNIHPMCSIYLSADKIDLNSLAYRTSFTVKMSARKTVVGKSFRMHDFKAHDRDFSVGPETDSCSDSSGSAHEHERHVFAIQCFGINERGQSCSIYIRDVKPFFFVRVGAHWTASHAAAFLAHIRIAVGAFRAAEVLSATMVDGRRLYGFTGDAHDKFVKLTFANTAAMRKARGLWHVYKDSPRGPHFGAGAVVDGDVAEPRNEKRITKYAYLKERLEIYEGNIPPLLRYFHLYEVSPSGWIFLKMTSNVTTPTYRTTTCDFEYECGVADIVPQPTKETRVPYNICSFDIEASSSHGDFPLPRKTYLRVGTQLADAFDRHSAASQLSASRATLFGKVLFAAFGHGTFDDVDRVFTKRALTRAEVAAAIEAAIAAPVKHTTATENAAPAVGGGIFASGRNPAGAKQKYTILSLLQDSALDRMERATAASAVLDKVFPPVEGDHVTFIGSTFVRYGDPEPHFSHCISLGICDPVPGVEIQCADTELELLLAWRDLMLHQKPDIIIGYNIFGFDYEFLFRRAQELNCAREFMCLSRNTGECCLTEPFSGEPDLDSTHVCLATGEYDMRYPRLPGAVQIDMYFYMRRDFSLASYKLDDVAGLYIGDAIASVDYENECTRLYTGNVCGLSPGDYVHIVLDGFTADYYRDGAKFQVVAVQQATDTGAKSASTVVLRGRLLDDIEPTKLRWAMAKDDVSPTELFALASGTPADRARVAKYCVQDCNLVHHLFNKLDVITGYVEMASICSVPISFLVFRGQGIKLTSFVAKKCFSKSIFIPDLEKTADGGGYEGAIVLPPKCAFYMDNPVACVDYASLYPSAMISQNYSHDSKVWAREFDLDGNLVHESGEKSRDGAFVYDNLPGYEYINVEFDVLAARKAGGAKEDKVKVGTRVCRWAQPRNGQKAVLPAILEELLEARGRTKKLMKNEPDPFVRNILDKRQLGYKVTANSLYGQCGSRTSSFYERDVAASTTATGRAMILYARRVVEDVYRDRVCSTEKHGDVLTAAEYIYGDTDSVFFTFNLRDPETRAPIRGQAALEITIELAQEAAALCTMWLKPPMELSYEKTLMPFILLSKKRYVGMLYETRPSNPVLKYMGLSLKRRDSCDYLKDVYGHILEILMAGGDIGAALAFLDQSLLALIEGKVHMDKLAITKALRSDYKNPRQIAHAVLAERMGARDAGNRPRPGDRMKFVHIVNADKYALQGDCIETPDFVIQNKLQIDYAYYITNQLSNPLLQLFGLALDQIWNHLKNTKAGVQHRMDLDAIARECGDDLEKYAKKQEKLCAAKARALLLDKHLTAIFNRQHGIRPITAFFGAR